MRPGKSTPADTSGPAPLVTSSRGGDQLLFGIVLLISLSAAPWLRVYFRITSFELHWVRIAATGDRSELPLPAEMDFAEYWNRTPEDLLPRIERRFRALARERTNQEPPGTRHSLTVRYSFNSSERDQTVTWDAP